LLLVAQQIGIPHPPSLADLTRIAGVQQDGASMAGMVAAAKAMGLHATGVQMDAEALANLANLHTPALAWVDGNHYVAVLNVTTDIVGVTSARIHDPNKADAETMTIPELLRRSGGVLLLLEKDDLKKGTPSTQNGPLSLSDQRLRKADCLIFPEAFGICSVYTDFCV
jgi:ABC-type bacteriocin/lantibiotic exporter with double-glycine peptidase domain